jgi:hypothetical protein
MNDNEPKSCLLKEDESLWCVPDELAGNEQLVYKIQTGRFELIIKHESDEMSKQEPTLILQEVFESPANQDAESKECQLVLPENDNERKKRQEELLALAKAFAPFISRTDDYRCALASPNGGAVCHDREVLQKLRGSFKELLK